MKKQLILSLVPIILCIVSCIEPYDLVFASQNPILFIEAEINDIDNNQYIKVQRNRPSISGVAFDQISDAKVTLIENKTTNISIPHKISSRYYLPANFKAKLNTPYKLRIELVDGNIYESSEEIINKVPKIDSVYTVLKNKGVSFGGKDLPGNEIYIDLTDNVRKNDYYLWQYRHYEKKSFCISCDGGRFFINPLPNGICIEDAFLKRRNVIYDYLCKSDCWRIYKQVRVNIQSDNFSNGVQIKSRLVAKIPILQLRDAMVEVQQFAVPKSAFEYFNTLISQGENTGTLADTPPVGLIGNIKNLNDKTEPVGGIFMVASKVTKSFMIRRDTKIPSYVPFGLLGGRPDNPEPAGPDTTRPPLAPCVEDEENTGFKPFGWLN